MLCDDPAVTYLKSYGYNVIRLPRADVRPLHVLGRQGKELDRLGELSGLLVSRGGNTLPVPTENTSTASISGRRTSDMGLGTGLSILGSFLDAMGGQRIGLDAEYKSARTVAFELEGVLEDRVDIIMLDRFLADSDVVPSSRHVAQTLDADQLYVITATIKSTMCVVDARDASGISLKLDIPAVQQIVGANVMVSTSTTGATRIVYQSRVPLVFGFQAVQLFYEQGVYKTFKSLPPDVPSRGLGEVEEAKPEYLTTPGAFVRLGGLE